MMASRTQLLPPSAALAPFVQAIAVRRPSAHGPALPALQCFPANGLGALTVLHRGDWVDADTRRPMAELELAGPRLQPARRSYGNDPAITTVLLRPGVLSWLFNSPASHWVNQRFALAEVLGSGVARALMSRLREASSTAAEVWLIEQQLHAWIEQAQTRLPWQAPPQIPTQAACVRDWAGCTDASVRQLQRRITDTLGLPPKAQLRMARLHHSLAQLSQGRSLAEIAERCGFSHAGHLVREFRALTGLSPAAVRRDLARHEGLPWLALNAQAS
ncbi:helix-turn-helix domain-containing protein [Paucibacter sp. APW11]|uniref:Helix-turn-helix domain-containing protein n=1 Tax=Roseateles aquae TaxID=3077235 RepID=A0ABU3PAW9_9BURK|nr:helix-turn-helix domain-containing protein [Paucibacter sp. APW11]MDT8999708.1 helix-turn-helix domain-containing protein [Paucibacter sp. APW11]